MTNIRDVATGAYMNIRLVTERLGGDFTYCKKQGIVGFDIAVGIEANIVSTHANIYSDLPTGTPRAAQELEYVAVLLQDGKTRRVLALPWIEQDVTIVEHVMAKATVRLENHSELDRLRKHLIQGGFEINDVSIIGA